MIALVSECLGPCFPCSRVFILFVFFFFSCFLQCGALVRQFVSDNVCEKTVFSATHVSRASAVPNDPERKLGDNKNRQKERNER